MSNPRDEAKPGREDGDTDKADGAQLALVPRDIVTLRVRMRVFVYWCVREAEGERERESVWVCVCV